MIRRLIDLTIDLRSRLKQICSGNQESGRSDIGVRHLPQPWCLFCEQVSDSRIRPTCWYQHRLSRPSETFQTAWGLCKTPFPSLLRRQEPSLKRSFSYRAGSRHQNMRNQIFDFIGILLFSEKCETSKALLCAGHPPTRERQISGFAKVSCRLKRWVWQPNLLRYGA